MLSDLTMMIPCPECTHPGADRAVECSVGTDVLEEYDVHTIHDIDVEDLYRLHDAGRAEIDGTCSVCGSDYHRDADGRISDDDD